MSTHNPEHFVPIDQEKGSQIEVPRTLQWEDRAIGCFEAAEINRQPTMFEYFFGIREEMLDPVLREAIIIFAEKGYVPFSSCQGHNAENQAYITFEVPFSAEVLEYFLTLGDQGLVPHSLFSHSISVSKFVVKRSPNELRDFMIKVAQEAPLLGEMVFIDSYNQNEYMINGVLQIRQKFPRMFDTQSLPAERLYSTLAEERLKLFKNESSAKKTKNFFKSLRALFHI